MAWGPGIFFEIGGPVFAARGRGGGLGPDGGSQRLHRASSRWRLRRVKNHEQQLQGPRKADQDKTDSYCLDRR